MVDLQGINVNQNILAGYKSVISQLELMEVEMNVIPELAPQHIPDYTLFDLSLEGLEILLELFKTFKDTEDILSYNNLLKYVAAKREYLKICFHFSDNTELGITKARMLAQLYGAVTGGIMDLIEEYPLEDPKVGMINELEEAANRSALELNKEIDTEPSSTPDIVSLITQLSTSMNREEIIAYIDKAITSAQEIINLLQKIVYSLCIMIDGNKEKPHIYQPCIEAIVQLTVKYPQLKLTPEFQKFQKIVRNSAIVQAYLTKLRLENLYSEIN